jgi:hypothetical protein
MAFSTGDLVPRASGRAHLGIDGGSQVGSFSHDELIPYGNIHLTSGVWHDPMLGQSGVIRFNQALARFEQSVDGGVTFSAIGAGAGGGVTDLDEAYDGGNEIDQHSETSIFSADSSFETKQIPVVIKQVTPGGGSIPGHTDVLGLEDAAIVASGFTLTPNVRNSYAYTAIGPGFFSLQASGTATGTRPPSFILESLNFGTLASASGLFLFNAENSLIFNNNGGFNSNIIFNGVGNGKGEGGQIKFQPFNSSGTLEYRFGPHEAWYWRPSYSPLTDGPQGDGYHPIPHSGQIVQMILEQAPGAGSDSLQASYDGGNEIDLVKNSSLNEQVGITILEENLGEKVIRDRFTESENVGVKNFGIAVSGFSLTPTDPETAGLAALASNGLYVRGSGAPAGLGTAQGPAEIHIGFLEGVTNIRDIFEPDLFPVITASGTTQGLLMRLKNGLDIDVTGTAATANITMDAEADIDILAGDDLALGGVQSAVMTAVNANATINSTFNQVRLNSWSGSGQFTYRFGPFESWHTTNGFGDTNLVPIAHSGHVAQMIATAVAGGGGSHTIQAAYDGGNAATINGNGGINAEGVLVRTDPGVQSDAVTPILGTEINSYGFAVSGYNPTPDNPATYEFAKLSQNGLTVKSSGTAFTPATSLFVGFQTGSPSLPRISSSGGLFFQAIGSAGSLGSIDFSCSNSWTAAAGGSISFSATDDVTFGSATGDVDLRAGTLGSSDLGGQILLEAFDASGVLEYRFGPHQSWYMKTSHSSTSGPFGDGFNPLVPSGQIIQMILENSGGGSVNDLQDAYDGGNEIAPPYNDGDYQGILVKEPIGLLSEGTSLPELVNRYGVAVSGFHAGDQNNPSTFGFAKLTSMGLAIKSSGILGVDNPNAAAHTVFMGYLASGPQTATILTSGTLNFTNTDGDINLDAGDDISLLAADEITITADKTSFVPQTTESVINIQGVVEPPDTNLATGDLAFLGHTHVYDPQGQTTLATVQARSLGPSTFSLDTGSGIVALTTCSGIQKYRDDSATVITGTFPASTTVDMDSQRFEDDKFSEFDATGGGPRVFVPGLYRVTGHTFLSSNTTTTLYSWIEVNGTIINGSREAGPVLANNFIGFSCHAVVNLQTRDQVTLEASKGSAGATVVAASTESTLYLEYLGPPRGQLQ